MENQSTKFTGILMAGGKSSRMGQEKGLIKVGNQMLFEYSLHVLESFCDEIIISGCAKDYFPKKYAQYCDEMPGLGPMGGIYTCLKKSSNHINIVLSYDLPLVKKELFDELLKQTNYSDMVLPASAKGRLEPLCGVYTKNAIPVFEKMIESGNYSVHKAMDLLKSKAVSIHEKLPFYNPDLFLNINNKSDLDKLFTLVNK
jgi:molybdopterin-guanine dinucleotide biosynthesis protein A